jgi:hypothetical protein
MPEMSVAEERDGRERETARDKEKEGKGIN